MRAAHKLFFRGAGVQIVAIVAALCTISSARAQSSSAFGVIAAGQTQHAGSGLGAGSLQDPGLVSTTHTTTSTGFLTAPGQSTATFNTTSTGSTAILSPGLSYGVPGDVFGIASPTEPAISENGLFSFFDVLRAGPGDPMGRLIPGVGNSNMDVNGANHFDGTVAPRWIFCRQSRYPVTVTLPMQMTLHEDPYYFGHQFGWIAAGANIRVPLSFIPRQYGNWSAATSADLCYYGTTKSEFMNSVGLQVPRLGASFGLQF